jgi:hypothetical protein
MAVYVTEHYGLVMQERQSVGIPLAAYSLTSGSTPVLPSTLTNFIRVSADAASLISFMSSSTTAPTLSSTNAYRIPANAPPERFQLSNPSGNVMRICAQST